MLDELEFRSLVETALNSLMRHLMAREEEADSGFEVEEQGGMLTVLFEEPADKFVITPNAPVRQIWISALATSFKMDWDQATCGFVLARTGEDLKALIDRLIAERLAG